jgi:hypothetical protein
VLDHVPELGLIDQWSGFREHFTRKSLIGIILLQSPRDSPIIFNLILPDSRYDSLGLLSDGRKILAEKVIYTILAP